MKKQPPIRILAAALTLAFCILGSSSALAAPAATPTTRPEKEVVEPNDTTQTSLDYLEFLLRAGGPFRFQKPPSSTRRMTRTPAPPKGPWRR